MRALVFDGCFGWLHPARGKRGVVLCAPHGYEALCTHRPWRALAERLAAAGLPTLRFDYPGTGDSAGSDDDPDRLTAWRDGIRAAVRRLREETGVTEVALVGLRLGALLATLTAEEMATDEIAVGGTDRIDALALLAPCVTGKSYVQRLKAFSRMAVSPDGTAPPRREQTDEVEYGGFILTPETQSALIATDLLSLRNRPAPKVLILNAGAPREAQQLVTELERHGSDVEVQSFDGYVGMMRDAIQSEIPDDAFARVVDWLRDPAATGPAEVSATEPQPDVQLLLNGAVEQPVRFNDPARLFGIVCKPRASSHDGSRPAVLFLNTGVNAHIGTSRMSVTLARRLAARGIASLRIDTANLGDAGRRPGAPEWPSPLEEFVCSEATCAEVTVALDWLQAQGYRKCIIIGLCSGATLGLNLSLVDSRVAGLVMINIQRFHLAGGGASRSIMLGLVRKFRALTANSASPTHWQIALRTTIRVVRMVTTHPAQRLKAELRQLFARPDAAAPQDPNGPEALMRRLSDRGIPSLLVYGENDVSGRILVNHFGKDVAALRALPNIRVEQMSGADHTLSLRSLREEFARILESHLVNCGVLTADGSASAKPAAADTVPALEGRMRPMLGHPVGHPVAPLRPSA